MTCKRFEHSNAIFFRKYIEQFLGNAGKYEVKCMFYSLVYIHKKISSNYEPLKPQNLDCTSPSGKIFCYSVSIKRKEMIAVLIFFHFDKCVFGPSRVILKTYEA